MLVPFANHCALPARGLTWIPVPLRIRWLRICFFSSWSVFPFLWVISAQGACIANEEVVSSIHIPADIIAKNVFGLLVWHIRFTLCDGYWDIERFKQRLLEDRLLEFFEDPDTFREEHMMQVTFNVSGKFCQMPCCVCLRTVSSRPRQTGQF
jgi:hypothetical protein